MALACIAPLVLIVQPLIGPYKQTTLKNRANSALNLCMKSIHTRYM